jgi:hypothetical protein
LIKKSIYILLLIWLNFGCNVDDVSLDRSEPIPVVEGWLTDIDTFQRLRLTYTQSFGSADAATVLDNASVQVLVGNNPQYFSYDQNGWYISNNEFAGKPGMQHQLRITTPDGVIISTGEIMSSAPTIDSLMYDFYEQPSEEDSDIIEVIYYPIATIIDEGNERNYYRWRVYRNDSLFSAPESLVLVSDRFFNGNETTFENEFTSFDFAYGDSITLELMEISVDAYNYLRLLKNQTTTLGTISSVTPAGVIGNLQYLNSNKEVLGFWGVASIQKAGRIISE